LRSSSFEYRYSHISVPVVVGMRARTSHRTLGNFSTNFGCVVGPEGASEEKGKTGMDRGSFSCNGVAEPGVEGGVKAGDINAGMCCEPTSEREESRRRR
jgi:hypothetical protein